MLPAKRSPWALDRHFWLFAVVMFVLQVASLAFAALAARTFGPALAPFTADLRLRRVILVIVFMMVASFLTMRIVLWPLALLLGDRAVGLTESWRRMGGLVIAAFLAMAVLSFPFLVAHFGLSAWSQLPAMSRGARLVICYADGPVSVLQLMLDLAVIAALYKLTAARATGR